jgi:hypothetical protein
MRHLLIITTFFLASTKTFAYNPFWTHIDKKLISAIINLDKNNPKEVEQYFKNQRIQKNDTTKEILGFGWTMWTPGTGGGYISISAKFFYFNDSLVSYSLTPRLPEEKGLQKRYKKWYGDYFAYSNSEIQTFSFNQTIILKPLNQYTGALKSIPDKIATYMTPNSGTMYGYAGGGLIMENRRAFLGIKDSLTNDQVLLLMYSINPASRLTAIEYYLKRKSSFENQEAINNWIEQNFREMPTVKSMSGCFSVTEETKAFVYMHSLMADK